MLADIVCLFLSRPAIEHFTQRVFMLPSQQFFPKHALMLSTLRKALVPAELAQHMQRLAILMFQRLKGKTGNTGKVMPFGHSDIASRYGSCNTPM